MTAALSGTDLWGTMPCQLKNTSNITFPFSSNPVVICWLLAMMVASMWRITIYFGNHTTLGFFTCDSLLNRKSRPLFTAVTTLPLTLMQLLHCCYVSILGIMRWQTWCIFTSLLRKVWQQSIKIPTKTSSLPPTMSLYSLLSWNLSKLPRIINSGSVYSIHTYFPNVLCAILHTT